MKKYLFSLLAIFCGLVGFVSCTEEPDENLEQYYTVDFNSMGGSEVESQKVKAGELAVKPGNPSKDGEVFISWFTSDKFDSEWNFEKNAVNADVTLFAKWSKPDEVCIVTFESNGGSKVESKNVEKGGKLSVLPEPTRDGFTFDGWYKDADFKTKFELSETINGNITLYAKWKAESEDALKKKLNELITKANALKAEDWSKRTYEFMQKELKEAKAIVDKSDISEKKLQLAYDNLAMAVNYLLPPVLDKPNKIECDLFDGFVIINNKSHQKDIWFNVEDLAGNSCYDSNVELKYDKAKLDTWCDNVSLNDYYLHLELKENLPVDDEISITASLKDNPSISKEVKLKIFDSEALNKMFIEKVELLLSKGKVDFDNYLEAYDISLQADLLLENIMEEDRTKIQEYISKYYDYCDKNLEDDGIGGIYDMPLIEIEKDKFYIIDGGLCKYTPSANGLPDGVFETGFYEEDDTKPDGTPYIFWYQEKLEISSQENKITTYEREIDASEYSSVTEWMPEYEYEYKYIEKENKIILRLKKEYK